MWLGFAWFSHFCEINGCGLLVLNASPVLDNAEGMAANEMTKIFKPPMRLSNSWGREIKPPLFF